MLRASFWISLAYLLTPSLCLHQHEIYKEHLRVQPLRDGRISTTFSFVTVLEGAVPRNPTALELTDECVLALNSSLSLISEPCELCSTALRPLSTYPRSNLTPVRYHRAAPYSQCW